MPRVTFTPHLQRHVSAPSQDATGNTLREVLENVFQQNPRLRGYVLDDQGRARQHIMVFIDNCAFRDRGGLSDSVRPESEVFVMQALSGG